MSIDLILEVMDHAPADLTSGERLALIVIAERANDRTRIATQSARWTLDTIAHRAGVKRTGLKSIFQGLARKGCEVRVPVKVTDGGKPVFAFEGTALTFKVPNLAQRGGRSIPSAVQRGGHSIPTESAEGMPQHPRGEAVASERGGHSHPQTLMTLKEPSLSAPAADSPPVEREHVGERDDDSPKTEPQDPRHRLVMRHGATAEEAPQVVADIQTEYTPRNNGWWRTVDRQGDLGDIVAMALTRIRTTTPDAPTPAGQAPQPPQCGACHPNRLVWVRAENGRVAMAPCPTCHRRRKPLPPGAAIVDGPEAQSDITPRPAPPAPACGRSGCRHGWYQLGVNRVRCHICPDPQEPEIECAS